MMRLALGVAIFGVVALDTEMGGCGKFCGADINATLWALLEDLFVFLLFPNKLTEGAAVIVSWHNSSDLLACKTHAVR